MAAITASSISTPGAIMLELPDSSRWDTTTARRDFRATSSRGSRPYGAKASRRHVEAEHLRGLRVDRQLVLAMVAAFRQCSMTFRNFSCGQRRKFIQCIRPTTVSIARPRICKAVDSRARR